MAVPFRDDLPSRRFPWVTLALIVLNVVVFAFVQPSAFQNAPDTSPQTMTMRDYERRVEAERFSFRWGAVPCEVVSGESVAANPPECEHDRNGAFSLPDKAVYLALLTSMFLHGNLPHIVSNMLFLWVFGRNLEDRIGPWWYLAVYLVGGVIAALSFVAVNQHTAQPLIGASGAIAAAMGAYLVFHPRSRILTAVTTAAFQVVYVPAVIVLGLFFVTQFFTADEHVAWEAHVGGMVAGVAMALVLGLLPSIKRQARTRPRPAATPEPATF